MKKLTMICIGAMAFAVAGTQAQTLESLFAPDFGGWKVFENIDAGGAEPAVSTKVEGKPGFMFEGTFREGKDRMQWEASKLTLDLSHGDIITASLFVGNSKAIRNVSFYFINGKGSYILNALGLQDGWNDIKLKISDIRKEGDPGPLDAIAQVCLFVWKKVEGEQASVFISNVSVK